jgi:hypothetical protein
MLGDRVIGLKNEKPAMTMMARATNQNPNPATRPTATKAIHSMRFLVMISLLRIG